MIFFMGGPNSIFFSLLRAKSVIFWRFTPKPEFQQKIRFAHRNLKKMLNSFLISNLFNEYFV